MQCSHVTTALLGFAVAFLPSFAFAQIDGYVNGSLNIFSFNPATGSIVTTTTSGGNGYPFVVANDDLTLYVAYGVNGPLKKVDGSTGAILGNVNLNAISAALSSDGSVLYVAGFEGIAAVDPATLTVINSVSTGPCGASEAVLSPDNSTLYSYLHGEPGCGDFPPQCNGAQQCTVAFSTSTLALQWSIPSVGGALSLSNDGLTLYAVLNLYPPLTYPARAIDTATQSVTYVPVPGPDVFIATSPVSPYAVVVSQGKKTANGGGIPAAAYLLNTATNEVVGTLFSSAPGDTGFGGGSSPQIAIAPNGKSVWMILRCPAKHCPIAPNQPYLAGFSLPSTSQIAFEPLQNQLDALEVIAFPRPPLGN